MRKDLGSIEQQDQRLSRCMGEDSIATQIGGAKHPPRDPDLRSEALIHKMLKNRAAGRRRKQSENGRASGYRSVAGYVEIVGVQPPANDN